MKVKGLDPRISHFVKYKERIFDNQEYWAVLIIDNGGYLAIWIDGDGVLHQKMYKYAAPAVKLARSMWGTTDD